MFRLHDQLSLQYLNCISEHQGLHWCMQGSEYTQYATISQANGSTFTTNISKGRHDSFPETKIEELRKLQSLSVLQSRYSSTSLIYANRFICLLFFFTCYFTFWAILRYWQCLSLGLRLISMQVWR